MFGAARPFSGTVARCPARTTPPLALRFLLSLRRRWCFACPLRRRRRGASLAPSVAVANNAPAQPPRNRRLVRLPPAVRRLQHLRRGTPRCPNRPPPCRADRDDEGEPQPGGLHRFSEDLAPPRFRLVWKPGGRFLCFSSQNSIKGSLMSYHRAVSLLSAHCAADPPAKSPLRFLSEPAFFVGLRTNNPPLVVYGTLVRAGVPCWCRGRERGK